MPSATAATFGGRLVGRTHMKLFLGWLTVLPFMVTYMHLYNLLTWHKCKIYRFGGNYEGPGVVQGGGGIQCRDSVKVLSTTTSTTSKTTIDYSAAAVSIPDVPPSVAYLTTNLMDGLHSGKSIRNQRRNTESGQEHPNRRRRILLANNIPDGETFDMRTLDYTGGFSASSPFHFSIFSSSDLRKDDTAVQEVNDTASSQNKYGFRTNRRKQAFEHSSTSSKNPPSWPVLPLTTMFFLALNIGLYLLFWRYSMNPNTVALNKLLLLDTTHADHNSSTSFPSENATTLMSDFGRSLTGHTSHFEIWHLGFNMMTLHSLGPVLEKIYGSVPLLFYTAAFLPISTIIIIGLWITFRRCHFSTTASSSTTNHQSQQRQQPFPSMVGFSGILFAWMVVATLQNTNQLSCPIPMLPNLCFQTQTLNVFGKVLHVNFAPLAQLAFLQVVLPRVSFYGHLAGVIVGFAWKWKFWLLVPPLEYCQPSISYPVLWVLGKYMLHHNPKIFDAEASGDSGSMGGHRLGGGAIGGENSWRMSRLRAGGNSDNQNRNPSSTAVSLLRLIHSLLTLHLIALIFFLTKAKARRIWTAVTSSVVLSQVMMTALLAVTIRTYNSVDSSSSFLRLRFGTTGRAYVVFVLVTWVTDSMTLGGWVATRVLWQGGRGVQVWWIALFVVWIIRMCLWSITLGLVCNMLLTEDELLNRGIWFHTLSWSVVEPSGQFGKMLLEYSSKWRRVDDDGNDDHITLMLSSFISPGLQRANWRGISPRRRHAVQGAHEITDDDEEERLVSDVI